jgi:hypothetical protein
MAVFGGDRLGLPAYNSCMIGRHLPNNEEATAAQDWNGCAIALLPGELAPGLKTPAPQRVR